jgi:hypothetical protein
MINYIIIFFSQSNCTEHLSVIKRTMTSIIEWTQDLEDCDKVIRVSTSRNISVELLEKFTKIGLKAELMAVYQVDQQ